jgi:hypothetical protein
MGYSLDVVVNNSPEILITLVFDGWQRKSVFWCGCLEKGIEINIFTVMPDRGPFLTELPC